MTTDEYKPIDCDLYDQYVIWSTRKNLVVISSIDDSFLPIESKIKDLITKDSLEYVVTSEGVWFRADRVKIVLK